MWWFKTWLHNLLIIAPDPSRMSGVASKEVPRPDQSLSNFADWYRHLKLDTDDQEYLKDLAEIFEGFARFRLEEVGGRKREIKACFHQTDDPKHGEFIEYTLDELSDGQRVLIGLYAILHFALRPGTTVCFDEPDNFIALREIQPWLDKVFDRAGEEGEAQVIIASHHPELLNKMAYKKGLLFDRPGGRQTRVKQFNDPADTGLSAAELVARGWES